MSSHSWCYRTRWTFPGVISSLVFFIYATALWFPTVVARNDLSVLDFLSLAIIQTGPVPLAAVWTHAESFIMAQVLGAKREPNSAFCQCTICYYDHRNLGMRDFVALLLDQRGEFFPGTDAIGYTVLK